MWYSAVPAWALALVGAAVTHAEMTPPQIEHDALLCIQAGRFPRLCSHIDSEVPLRQARAYFRSAGTENWYFVNLEATEGEWCSALPSPLASTPAVEYYIEAVDEAFDSGLTRTVEADVVEEDDSCATTPFVWTGALPVFEALTGLPKTPAGFAAIKLGAAGASAAATSAGAGSASGLSGATLGWIAAGAGAAATAGVALNRNPSPVSTGPPSMANVATGAYTLAGGSNPSIGIQVDDIIRASVNGELVQEYSGCERSGFTDCVGPPITFQANPGERLTIAAFDTGGTYILGPLWLHRGDRSTQLKPGSGGCDNPSVPCPAPSPNAPVRFYEMTFRLPF